MTEYNIFYLILFLIAWTHLALFVLETFYWTSPVGERLFGLTEIISRNTNHTAVTHGLLNLLLGAALLWTVYLPNLSERQPMILCFLGLSLTAGVYGGVKVHRRLHYIQVMPVIIALCFFSLDWHVTWNDF